MGFLIDTCVWVAIERGQIPPAEVAAVTGSEPVFISPVTIAELKFGAETTADPDLRQKRLAAIDRLIKKPILHIDESTGELFGRLAAALKATGRGHGFRIQDLWLARQTIHHEFRLLTYNRKDFEDVPGLDLVVMPPKEKKGEPQETSDG